MTKHYARVLDLHDLDDAQREVEAIHGRSWSRRRRADGTPVRAVRIESLAQVPSVLLRDSARLVDMDCFVDESVPILWENRPRSAVLCGTLRQYRGLEQRLRSCTLHDLREVAAQVRAALDAHDAPIAHPLRIGRHELPLGQRTLVMGIINVTPDSFSGDGLGSDVGAALDQAKRFAEEGADILDVGGQSTRPGSEEVGTEVEKARVLPVIERIVAKVDRPVSIDTSRMEVASAALDAGAGLVNDVWALREQGMVELAAERQVPVCLMHMQGTPRTMQDAPRYDDLITDIYQFLADRVEACTTAGLAREQILIDPGIGFGKTVNHNLTILRRLREFRSLGCAVLIGTSRKSTIGKVLGGLPAEERLEGTAATCACAIMNGADIIRAHDVKQMVRVARMTDAIMRGVPDL